MKTYEPMCGEDIKKSAIHAVALSIKTGEPVEFRFNEIVVTVPVGASCDSVVDQFHQESKRRHDEYKRSPAGIEAELQRKAFQEKAHTAAAEGFKPFTLKDAAGWQKSVDVNQDSYGASGLRYAARWANLMELKMSEGKVLSDIAKSTSHEADLEGISGFQYGCAVSLLSQVWIHGEKLKEWDNEKS